MEAPIYTYCLLQYRHSQFLDEVLNIGILVHFHDTNNIYFECPEKLLRLKFAYINIPEKTIKSYFKFFKEKVNWVNHNFGKDGIDPLFSSIILEPNEISFGKFIHQQLLPPDSSAIQFGKIKRGLKYSKDEKFILDQLFNQYFSFFSQSHDEVERKDEIHLLSDYKKLIKEIGGNVFEKPNAGFQQNVTIEAPDKAPFSFEIAWKLNESWNLVKPVSLDVKKDSILMSKAYKFYGEFIDWEEVAKEKKYKIDVILAKPKSASLFKSFDLALKLFEKPKYVGVVFENELRTYSEKTVQALSLFQEQNVDLPSKTKLLGF